MSLVTNLITEFELANADVAASCHERQLLVTAREQVPRNYHALSK